jgi:prolyl oligopeptidase
MTLYVAEALGGPARVLVDPALLGIGGPHVSLDWWSVAPDGRHVAYGLSAAGSEQSVLHVLDAETGGTLPERIDRTPFAGPSWLPDSSGFFYNRLQDAPPKSIESRQDSVCLLHRLGGDPSADLPVLGRGVSPGVAVEPFEIPAVYADPTADRVVGVLYGGVRHANPLLVARLADVLAGAPDWQAVAGVEDSITDFTFRGDDLYLLSTRDAPNGRMLRTSLSAPDLQGADEVAAESAVVIERLNASADAVYLRCIDAGYGLLNRLTETGLEPVPLPYEGSVVGLYAGTAERRVHVALTGWLQPRGVWTYEPGAVRLTDTGFPARPDIDVSPYQATRSYAAARDGTRVPVSIVARRDAPRDGSNCALVNGYGAYQVVLGPVFNPRAFAFLEQGGILVTAHVRGGGEYGEAWWKAGRGPTKPNSWRDLIDVCEHLCAEGWTRPAHLAIRGGSAGGITVGRALTERPDLFAACVCSVGVLNTLRAEFAPNGPPNVPEYGTIATQEGFEALVAMDSIHAVEDGVAYPPVLLTHGMTDPRVEPWHSAKMTARLQAASAGGEVLLRVTFDAGHGVGSTRSQLDEETADIYAFVLAHAAGRGAGRPRSRAPARSRWRRSRRDRRIETVA